MVEGTATMNVVIISTKTAGGDLKVTITIALSTTNRAHGFSTDPYSAQGEEVITGLDPIVREETSPRINGHPTSLEGGEVGVMREEEIKYKVSKHVLTLRAGYNKCYAN